VDIPSRTLMEMAIISCVYRVVVPEWFLTRSLSKNAEKAKNMIKWARRSEKFTCRTSNRCSSVEGIRHKNRMTRQMVIGFQNRINSMGN